MGNNPRLGVITSPPPRRRLPADEAAGAGHGGVVVDGDRVVLADAGPTAVFQRKGQPLHADDLARPDADHPAAGGVVRIRFRMARRRNDALRPNTTPTERSVLNPFSTRSQPDGGDVPDWR